MKRFRLIYIILLIVSAGLWTAPVHATDEHVILISIDGFRSDAITVLGPEGIPHIYKLIQDGASTLNARTDVDKTNTLPNHTCMLTGLGVMGPQGHNYTINEEDERTLHDLKGHYVSSVFDVLYPALKHSAFLASKNKFVVFPRSYGCRGIEGYPDYKYNEAQLIDACKISDYNDGETIKTALNLLQNNAPYFLFIHLSGTDRVGHRQGWNVKPGSPYLEEVQYQDSLIGQILKTIEENPDLAHSTAIILTSDHGGTGKDHQEIHEPKHFTIPFIVWGKDVAIGSDLYELNPGTRREPGNKQIPYSEELQPIRNGDAANLALSLLGLPAVPGSTINARQDLKVSQ